MVFEKLTYSGTECNNYLYFSLDGDYFNTDFITAELGIEPTSLIIKKNPAPKSTSWIYKIDVGQEIDLETPLEKLIILFEKKITEIILLKKKLGLISKLQFVIDIDINPEASTPYFGLNKRVINFLNKTNSEVDFDLYKTDTIGILANK